MSFKTTDKIRSYFLSFQKYGLISCHLCTSNKKSVFTLCSKEKVRVNKRARKYAYQLVIGKPLELCTEHCCVQTYFQVASTTSTAPSHGRGGGVG